MDDEIKVSLRGAGWSRDRTTFLGRQASVYSKAVKGKRYIISLNGGSAAYNLINRITSNCSDTEFEYDSVDEFWHQVRKSEIKLILEEASWVVFKERRDSFKAAFIRESGLMHGVKVNRSEKVTRVTMKLIDHVVGIYLEKSFDFVNMADFFYRLMNLG
jgi:hypothetical protein